MKQDKKTSTSPFKDKDLLIKEITGFVNKFKSTFQQHSSRISDFFEMTCYNKIVDYYRIKGYNVSVQNLQGGAYKYKCSPSGLQEKYSFFKIEKDGEFFEIQHNLAVQSCFQSDVFTNPDIVVIKEDSYKTTTDYYEIKRRFSYVTNENMITFFECKHFNPFPELVFNFIGVVNELRTDILWNEAVEHSTPHLAPSILLSGKANKQTLRIKDSLESRYCINIIYDMFYSSVITFSASNIDNLRMVGALEEKKSD